MLFGEIELADHAAGLRHVVQSGLDGVDAVLDGGQRHRQDRGLHRDLGLGLDLAQLLDGLAGPSQRLRGGTGGCCGIDVGLRPSGAVHGPLAGVHPAPHLFGGEWQVRGQQAREGVQA